MKRFGSADSGLREGKGSVSTEGSTLETYPSFFSCCGGGKPGTNPEELLGAAHAACFKARAHSALQRAIGSS